MSNFNCDKCGALCLGSEHGYASGCEHYPPDVMPTMEEAEKVFEKVEQEYLCVVRLITNYWRTRVGCTSAKDLRYLRRKCKGYNLLEEDLCNLDPQEVMTKITNLMDVPDGVYSVKVCSESRDWETGQVDDYDYVLVPYGRVKSET